MIMKIRIIPSRIEIPVKMRLIDFFIVKRFYAVKIEYFFVDVSKWELLKFEYCAAEAWYDWSLLNNHIISILYRNILPYVEKNNICGKNTQTI